MTTPKLQKTISTIILVLVILGTIGYPGWWLLQHRDLDLPSYYVAGTLVLEAKNPYHPVELGTTAQNLGLDKPIYPYIYFPMLAISFMPLTLLEYPTVQMIWFIITEGFFWLSVGLLIAIIRHCYDIKLKVTTIKGIILIALCTVSYPLVINFINGQVNTIILFLLCAFLYLLIHKSDHLAGVALGIVSMLKPQPLILIPYLVYKKRYRSALVASGTFVFGTISTALIIGWQNFIYYLKEVLPTFSMVKTSFPPIPLNLPANQSIHGFVARLFQTSVYSTAPFNSPEWVKPVSTLLVVIILLVSGFRIWSWRNSSLSEARNLLREVSFLIIVSILLSPITWDHHLILAVIAMVFIYFESVSHRVSTPAFLAALLCWILLIIPLFPDSRFWLKSAVLTLGISLKTAALLSFWSTLAFTGVTDETQP